MPKAKPPCVPNFRRWSCDCFDLVRGNLLPRPPKRFLEMDVKIKVISK